MTCPICKRPLPESATGEKGSHYPFCSDRCKLIDLGRWLSGRYPIPVVDTDEAHDGEVDDEPSRHAKP